MSLKRIFFHNMKMKTITIDRPKIMDYNNTIKYFCLSKLLF
jgi:hypothetical protein